MIPLNGDSSTHSPAAKPSKHSTAHNASHLQTSTASSSTNKIRHGSISAMSNVSSANSHMNNSSLNMPNTGALGTGTGTAAANFNSPLTPTGSYTQLYPSSLHYRRFSKDTICSSSSSLYEANMAQSNCAEVGYSQPADLVNNRAATGAANNSNNINEDCISHTSSSFFKSYDNSSDEEDEDSDDDDIVSRNGISTGPKLPSLANNKNKFLFKKNWDITSPSTYSSNSNSATHSTSPGAQVGVENTPIFRRIVSRNSVKPQLKSFRRVSTELFQESLPFENEMNHENLVLLNLKEEEDILNHHAMKRQVVNEEKAASSGEKENKFDIIRKANESWNMKKSLTSTANNTSKTQTHDRLSSLLAARPQPLTPLTPITPVTTSNRPTSPTNSHTSTTTNLSQTTQHSTTAVATAPAAPATSSTTQHSQQPASVMLASLKNKRAFDNNTDESYLFKRRAVSTSPISSGYLKRSTNVKLISKTSNDLEKMSLG
ncbi:hypothetical protein WICPIJ_005457 [Wickerhamomyces pijperi]|uniref:Uncharacterized protein n=1 Tax=Wickerhamomyces pijperi TaxID=599730 RepID=A0A9P8Q3T6_WICPI|nr:hypothetical protein WICPIJ_005457 [Wickerhamomyces pijperi]